MRNRNLFAHLAENPKVFVNRLPTSRRHLFNRLASRDTSLRVRCLCGEVNARFLDHHRELSHRGLLSSPARSKGTGKSRKNLRCHVNGLDDGKALRQLIAVESQALQVEGDCFVHVLDDFFDRASRRDHAV